LNDVATPYPKTASIGQYLMNRTIEIALAHSTGVHFTRCSLNPHGARSMLLLVASPLVKFCGRSSLPETDRDRNGSLRGFGWRVPLLSSSVQLFSARCRLRCRPFDLESNDRKGDT